MTMELSTAHTVLFVCTVILTWTVSLLRAQCHLQSRCLSIITERYLVSDFQSSEVQVTVECGSSSGLIGWSVSRDGTYSTDSTLIMSSSSKYQLNQDSLVIRNVSTTDEGLYGCVYDNINNTPIPKRCIQVFSNAVFASCPLDYNGCTGDPDKVSVTEGGSVDFDASITYVPGATCGFQQEVTSVELRKHNSDEALCIFYPSSQTSQQACTSDRVSVTASGVNDCVFTLSNAVASDEGLYEAVARVRDVQSSSDLQRIKAFNLNFIAAPTTPAPVHTSTSPAPVTTTYDSTDTEFTSTTEISPVPSDSLLVPIIIAIVACFSIVVAVVSVVILVLVCQHLKTKKRPPPTTKDTEDVKAYAEVVLRRCTMVMNQDLPVEPDCPVGPVSLPPPYARPQSQAESESNLPVFDDEAGSIDV